MRVSSYGGQCSSSHSGMKCREPGFGSVNAVILNHPSIDEKQHCHLMSLPPVGLAFMSGHQQNNALMNHCHIPSQSATRDVQLGTATKCPTTSTGKTSSQSKYQLTPVSPQSASLAALRASGKAQSGQTTGNQIFTDSLTIAIKMTISEEELNVDKRRELICHISSLYQT